MIILHGLIREDGSVENLEILQGLIPPSMMRRGPLRALEFSPALEGGKPVTVEIWWAFPPSRQGA